MICFRFIPRTLPRNIRIDQALCRRKCPAEGWTDGLWCMERRRGEQKEKKKKSVGLLKTVSKFFSCLILDPLLSLSASPVFCAEGEDVAPCLRQLSPALPFTFRLLDVRCCCISPGLVVYVCAARAMSRGGRSRPVREALTPLSLMRVHADVAMYVELSFTQTRTNMYGPVRNPSIPPLSVPLTRMKSEHKLRSVTDRCRQL